MTERIVTTSELRTFRRCPQEHHYRYTARLEPEEAENSPLSIGRRVHLSLEEFDRTGTIADMKSLVEGHGAELAMLCHYVARYESGWHALRTNVPFAVEITPDILLIGEFDAQETGGTPVEHKTTSHDISPGSLYWQEVVHCDAQASAYALAGSRSVLWDVLRKPALRQRMEATKKLPPETDEEFAMRCMVAVAANPDAYFERRVVVRTKEELDLFRNDVAATVMAMRAPVYRDEKACIVNGKRCAFFGVCWSGQSTEVFEIKKNNHTEEVLMKLESGRA